MDTRASLRELVRILRSRTAAEVVPNGFFRGLLFGIPISIGLWYLLWTVAEYIYAFYVWHF